MNERDPVGLIEALAYAIAMVAGGVGGAGAAALALIRGRPVTGVYVAAYVVLGAVGGGISVGLDFWALSALLGERVAAVVAHRPDRPVDVASLDAHCREHLAGFKVPRRVVIVDEVLRRPSGKADLEWAAATVLSERP